MCMGDSVHEPEGDSIGNCEEKEALEHGTGAREETKKGVGGCRECHSGPWWKALCEGGRKNGTDVPRGREPLSAWYARCKKM